MPGQPEVGWFDAVELAIAARNGEDFIGEWDHLQGASEMSHPRLSTCVAGILFIGFCKQIKIHMRWKLYSAAGRNPLVIKTEESTGEVYRSKKDTTWIIPKFWMKKKPNPNQIQIRKHSPDWGETVILCWEMQNGRTILAPIKSERQPRQYYRILLTEWLKWQVLCSLQHRIEQIRGNHEAPSTMTEN